MSCDMTEMVADTELFNDGNNIATGTGHDADTEIDQDNFEIIYGLEITIWIYLRCIDNSSRTTI